MGAGFQRCWNHMNPLLQWSAKRSIKHPGAGDRRDWNAFAKVVHAGTRTVVSMGKYGRKVSGRQGLGTFCADLIHTNHVNAARIRPPGGQLQEWATLSPTLAATSQLLSQPSIGEPA